MRRRGPHRASRRRDERAAFFRGKGLPAKVAKQVADAELRMRETIAACVDQQVADAAFLIFLPDEDQPFRMAIADSDLDDQQREALAQMPHLISRPQAHAV